MPLPLRHCLWRPCSITNLRNPVTSDRATHRADLYHEAARQLGLPDSQPDRDSFQLFDGKIFNPNDPIGYLNSFEIHRPIKIEEVIFDSPVAATA